MLKRLIEKLAIILEQHKIPYMIIGGQAVLLYGEPRLTKDIDITLGVGPEYLEKLLLISKELRLKVLVNDVQEFVNQTFVLPVLDVKSGFRVDFIFSVSIYEKTALKRVSYVKMGKSKVCFTSIEDLIIHKIIAGRPRDIEDIKNVILINPQFDKDYVIKWLNNFDKELDKSYVTQFEKLLSENY